MKQCACGLEQPYDACCGRFIEGHAHAETPEQLMRSRYTAYTKANVDYIAKTMKSPAGDRFDKEEARVWATSIEWLKLEVLANKVDGDKGFVEFLAHFNQNKKRHVLHELSEFRCDQGEWYYIDGNAPKRIPSLPIQSTQVGRNEPCLCGSGKKYKKCCGGLSSISA